MGFSYEISRRLRLRGTHGANATGVAVGITGVALAILVMELTISIVLGFKDAITERVTGFDGKLWVMPDYNTETGESAPFIHPDPALTDAINDIIPDATVTGVFSQPGMLKTDNDFSGLVFNSFDTDRGYDFCRRFLLRGTAPLGPDSTAMRIVISEKTAAALSVDTADRVMAYFFANGAVKARRLEIAGVYSTGFSDYDANIVFAPISVMRSVAAADSAALTQINIDGTEIGETELLAARLQDRLIADYRESRTDKLYPVDNVLQKGAQYFQWLDLLDTNVVIIFILMLCVSAFTLVSSLFIIILERIPTIGVLRALGASGRQIRHVFIFMAMRIVGIGLLVGNAVAIGFLLMQQHWKFIPMDQEMYNMPYVPVRMNLLYFLLLNIGVVLISWLVLVLPARVASRISPSRTMRYE